jgi:glucan-binding YG repeat protein
VSSTSTISAGNWYHVVGVFESGSNISIYVNGVKENTAATTITVLNQAPGSWATTTIGYENGNRYYLNGVLDNVMIFNRALSASEIQNIYNSQLAMRIEPGKDKFFLNNLASILSSIQEVLEKLKSLF